MRILILSILFGAFFLSCSEPKVKPSVALIDESELPSQESWNDTIYISENGKLQAILTTSHLREFDEKKLRLLDSVYVRFFGKDGKLTSTLVADSGKVNDAKKEFTAIGNVVLRGSQGRVLFTPELSWSSKTGKIYTDKKVKIIDGDETLKGVGLVSDKNLDNYVIRKITFITTEENFK